MFKFDFDLDGEELGDGDALGIPAQADAAAIPEDVPELACVEITLAELLDTLPPAISYSPLAITSEKEASVTLSRRDLFDARFQLLAQADEAEAEEKDELRFVDAPSDLVRGVYEGGLKTWECSVDLAGYLLDRPELLSGDGTTRVLEIGCGTGIPSATLLQLLLSREVAEGKVELHLQDYNRSVLELVTLPNLFLAWYTSPLAVPHLDPDSPPRDPAEPGDVELTPALRSAFAASLASRGITLRFFAGGWRSFASSLAGPYALVLSSETIYEVAALPALVPLLRVASPKQDGALEDAVAGLDISGGGGGGGRGTCLVAAKVLYFGVGGGVPDFVRAVEGAGGRVDTVWERSEGVGRRIMRVSWS